MEKIVFHQNPGGETLNESKMKKDRVTKEYALLHKAQINLEHDSRMRRRNWLLLLVFVVAFETKLSAKITISTSDSCFAVSFLPL